MTDDNRNYNTISICEAEKYPLMNAVVIRRNIQIRIVNDDL